MSRVKNISIVAFRFFWNHTAGRIHKKVRFELDVKRILEKTFPPGSPFHFIQVGAHDGISHDFIYSFVKERDSSGLVIEPLPDLFLRLQSNYAYTKQIIPIQMAVHASLDKVILHRVDPKKEHMLPAWAGGIASLYRSHHLQAGIPEAFMVSEEVAAASFSAILARYPCSAIDLLQTDAEGYDLEILKMADLDTLRPRIVRIEINNLDVGAQRDATRLLQSKGYYCFRQAPDLIGIKLNKVSL